ncbi:glutamate-5-semialdehyde dehydrogenase [Sphingobacterium psychroaquaticum]|uniref:Gamma-glutamyl phosphate reductase n=1 Tax=Sphingobacterium psychroaquaticum TaxID=561061 RepID=A0A1X7L6W0_9SPHI|nr:glutamate-5-semialdehyde dehydrogenase [Sphingobacterium psychroaquaticum]SMG49618.1 glutamate-5-semialdehyde dehydrogenase [Sphingobacterium psychroaquaticum]
MKSIEKQLHDAKEARHALRGSTDAVKTTFLLELGARLKASVAVILEENKKDLERMDPEDPKYDRLLLTEERIVALADSVCGIAKLSDPTGVILSSKILDNGLHIEKKTVALGVVGVIYESRPNVTIDVAALCVRSGNVCVLRGGTDAWFTNNALVRLIQDALADSGLDRHIVQLLPTDRAFVQELLTATKYVDIIIPRGSQSLINFVRENAKVPVIETGAGVCHTYVERTADLNKAARIVANAKISRPSVCNSLDTVLVDKLVAIDFLRLLQPYFAADNVDVFADYYAYSALEELGYPTLQRATPEDFGREFLALACSIRVVDNMEEALTHIGEYSSKHSECIVSQDELQIDRFLAAVDAAAVYANASTRFTDGGEFGLGAEIGISTQKLHARGPFALEKLVTEKWFVRGNGQIRA